MRPRINQRPACYAMALPARPSTLLSQPLSLLSPMLSPMLLPLLLLLTGCNSIPTAPVARLGLTLPPATLGESIALQQHLSVERNGRIDELDVAIEIDAERLELVGLAFGQRVMSLGYRGGQLSSWRHPLLPAAVRAEDVLEDLQLTLWPLTALAAALPPGWTIQDQGLRRTLASGAQTVATIDYSGLPRWSGTVVLHNLRYNYRLTIQSAPSGAE